MLRNISKPCTRSLLARSRTFSSTVNLRNSGPSQIPDDILTNFAKNTVSKQDTDTFISVFNKIMAYKNQTKNENQTDGVLGSSNKKGTLQLIFEKNLNDRTQNLSVNESNDLRTLPLSVSSNMITPVAQNKSLIEQIQRKHELKEAIAPTINHMESIVNDYELITFIESLLFQFTQQINSQDFKNENLSDKLLLSIKDQSLSNPSTPIINQFTVPLFLTTAIKLLSSKFNSPVEAISLFQYVKNLDIKSYSFACTVDVYNEILERTWQNFKDPYLIDSLVNEMKVNGVTGDMDTISILGLVTNEMEKLLFGNTSVEQPSETHKSEGAQFGEYWNPEDVRLMKGVKKYRKDLMASM